MHIRYTQLAILDLDSIASHIAKDSMQRANKYIDKIQKKIELISEFPQMGLDCKNRNIDQDCKIYIFEDYLIFYIVESECINIKRVLHGSMDYEKKSF